MGATTPDSAEGCATFLSGGGNSAFFSGFFSSAGAEAAASFGLESREPTSSWGLYFLRMPSL